MILNEGWVLFQMISQQVDYIPNFQALPWKPAETITKSVERSRKFMIYSTVPGKVGRSSLHGSVTTVTPLFLNWLYLCLSRLEI